MGEDLSICTPYVDDFYDDRKDLHLEDGQCVVDSGIVPMLDSGCDSDQAWLQCCRSDDVMSVEGCLQVTPNISLGSVTCSSGQ